MKKLIKVHQHHIQMFLNCREMFNLSERLCVVPRVGKKYLDLGSAFHKGVSVIKQRLPVEQALAEANKYFSDIKPATQEEVFQIETGKVIVTAMLIGYVNKYQVMPTIKSVEQPISAKIGDIKLIGTPDSIEIDDNKHYWIGEEKTASRLDEDYVKRLPLDFQVTFYFLLSEKYYRKKFTGVNYRITRTPSIRQKKGQSLDQFCKEIANDYIVRPEFYFVNESLYRGREDIDRFKEWLILQVKEIVRCYKEQAWYPNTSRCTSMNCWYIPYCSDRREETFKTYLKEREDQSKCFSVMNQIW